MSVGPDKSDRLKDGMEVLDAQLQTCVHTSRLKDALSVPSNIGLGDALLGLGGPGNQHPNSQGDAAVAASVRICRRKERLASMMVMCAY